MPETIDGMSPEMAERIPDRFRPQRLIGHGSQKIVLLADDLTLGRQVVLAIYPVEQLKGQPNGTLDEARAMRRLADTPNIVRLIDLIEAKGTLILVSEYLSGGDLSDELAALQGSPLPIQRALRFARDVSLALDAAHQHGITHGDLKPANIYLNDKGDCFLGDFGFASLDAASENERSSSPLGSPAYMAPEVGRGEAVSPSSDLYSLGCLLYQLFTGHLPFEDDSATNVLRAQQLDQPAPLAPSASELPLLLNDLVLALLSKDPAERPSRAIDVARAIDAFRRTSESRTRSFQTPDPSFSSELLQGGISAAVFGRDREIARIDELAAAVISGVPRAILIRGDAGMGKSALLNACEGRLKQNGVVSLSGTADEHAPDALRPIAEALAAGLGDLSGVSPTEANAIRRLLFEKADPTRPGANVEERSSEIDNFAAVASGIRNLSATRPVVLILDDAHWLDSASAQLVRFLFENLLRSAQGPDSRIGIVLAFREPTSDSAAHELLHGINRSAHTERVDLKPLGLSAIQQILEANAVARPSNQLILDIREVTEGNPLVAEELIQDLVRTGGIRDRNGTSVCVENLRGQRTLRLAAKASEFRLQGLAPDLVQVLIRASFVGTRFELSTLAGLCDQTESELRDKLDAAIDSEIILAQESTYRFRHPTLREALYRYPHAEQRREIHARIAQLLESESTHNPGISILEVAHHAIRAEGLFEPEKTAQIASRGAAFALNKFAWREAAGLLVKAIELDSSTPSLTIAERAEAHRMLGRAYYHLGDAGPCLHHFDHSIELFRKLDDDHGEGWSLYDRSLAASLFGSVEYGAIGDIDSVRRVVERLGDREPKLRSRLLIAMAERYWAAVQSTEARHLCESALALAIENDDHEAAGIINRMVGLADWQELLLDHAAISFDRGAELSRRGGNALEEDRNRARIPLVVAMAGKFEDALETADQVIGLDRSESLLADTARLMVHSSRGQVQIAEQIAGQVIDELGRSRQMFAALYTLPAVAYVRTMGNDPVGGHAAYDRLLEPGFVFDEPNTFEPATRVFRQLIDLHRISDRDFAPSELLNFDAIGPEASLFNLSQICAQVELADATGFREIPTNVSFALESAESRGVLFTPGWIFSIPRIRAVVSALAGRTGEAREHYTRAIAVGIRTGSPIETARSQLGLVTLSAPIAADHELESLHKLASSATGTLKSAGPRYLAERSEQFLNWLSDRL